MQQLQDLSRIKNILEKSRKIAVVGFSPKKQRPSNMVGRYLIQVGYKVFPINPGHEKICQLKCYEDLLGIAENIDIVNIFRRSDAVMPIVVDSVRIGAKAIWMQQGIVNGDAARYAEENGVFVVMDRCIKTDHQEML